MHVLVINNPTSGGKGRNQKVMRELKEFFRTNQVSHEILLTDKDKNAEQLLAERSDFDHLVIVGGDGTINEAVNGLKIQVPVSIIPAGTGNDFVKNVTLKKNLRDQFDRIIEGEDWLVDLGECNERKFVNGIGIGFDGQIVHDMNGKKIPILKGHSKYYYHVLSILSSYREKPFEFKLGDQSFQDDLILMTIGNGTTFGGGFKLMPGAKIDDGLLEVCTIGSVSPLRRFLNISKLSNGSHGKLDEVEFHQVTKVIVKENDELFAHIDGEDLGQPPFEINILPKSLTLRI